MKEYVNTFPDILTRTVTCCLVRSVLSEIIGKPSSTPNRQLSFTKNTNRYCFPMHKTLRENSCEVEGTNRKRTFRRLAVNVHPLNKPSF
ncbi:hypothetical protein CDAR_416181 [Caerostris darwini]|uniref:Uncharacterized protein n=1 Tax=Caerostris darwini TaxID=1538125 RepID=A0AAV4W6G4_9ARAC|nr:hypothetical protein CDAR_416181 [Caerostris darwini]